MTTSLSSNKPERRRDRRDVSLVRPEHEVGIGRRPELDRPGTDDNQRRLPAQLEGLIARRHDQSRVLATDLKGRDRRMGSVGLQDVVSLAGRRRFQRIGAARGNLEKPFWTDVALRVGLIVARIARPARGIAQGDVVRRA